jgi:hypothetical protein
MGVSSYFVYFVDQFLTQPGKPIHEMTRNYSEANWFQTFYTECEEPLYPYCISLARTSPSRVRLRDHLKKRAYMPILTTQPGRYAPGS